MTDKPSELLLQCTDDDLLRELKRRGRLARLDAESTVPGRIVAEGLPLDYQTGRTCSVIADELARFIISGRTMPGYQARTVPSDNPYAPPSREERIVLNFVVDLPARRNIDAEAGR